ncbi:hypothetical protein [Enterocloster clostridioformis]|uniref:hypothetical protein n=1 Tax=Enterocloster clostridioformis TaxID=1531 RepID=UPI00135B3390|nr:hypothetical protein [Enterocloster clostridioformis]MCA5579234.1 hypothetical protein [Enterocloster clostridioformis]
MNGLPNISRSALELIGAREITTQEFDCTLQITAANTPTVFSTPFSRMALPRL